MVEKTAGQLHRHPIAVIGMAAVFPEAGNVREYWDNILRKIDCIIDVPPSHWSIDDYYDPDPSAPDKTYCKRGGFIPDLEFDPLEFGLPPNILEVTDTSQLLSLVIARDAMADAGYAEAPAALRERTGVVLGVGGGQKLISPLNARLQYPVWRKVLRHCGIPEEDTEKIIEKMKLAYVRWEENAFPGALGNVVAGRIANRLDLGGINTVVDAACASSLSAVNVAVSELVQGRADMMITGGVDTDNSIFMYMCFSKTPAFSRGDNPRPFDIDSSGMMVGEGIGMLVLKRLADAERDGDRIYAVIKGIGASSDGRYKSIYAPRTEGQELALRRAYEDAGFSPATVGLVEAHGTGTVAGDLTESATLGRFFGAHTPRKQYIALGSVKSQIGHTKAAAGAAGLIKTVLALHHKILPPMINIEQPNPRLGLEDSPFYLNTEARPWLPFDDETPRRAGVTAAGFGGTNFHVVLEEHTQEHKAAYRLHTTPQVILLSAPTPAELQTLCTATADRLQGDEAEGHFRELTHPNPIPLNAARVGFVAASPAEARDLARIAGEMLAQKPEADEWQHPRGIHYRKAGLKLAGRVVALFPGQGSQYLNMGRELVSNFPALRDAFRSMDTLFARDGARLLSEVVFPPTLFDNSPAQAEALQRTEYAQPAIGAFSVGLYRLLREAGFRADFAAGHSFGELSALWAAGALSDEDYFRLVRARGQAMAPAASPAFEAGAMLAVRGETAEIEKAIQPFAEIVIANMNSPRQVVVAGPDQAIAEAGRVLEAKGHDVVPLPVSAAFHTPLVGHAQQPFAAAVNSVAFRAPHTTVYANTTGDAYPADPAVIQRMLTEHILRPVQFQRQIENIYAAGGYLFVEFGPRNILTNLVKDILGERPHVAIALNANRQKDSDWQLREAVTQLCVLGLPLGAIDPYARWPERPKLPERRRMSVRLNGANYVSEKTHSAFEEALADGYRANLPKEGIAESVSPPVSASPAAPSPEPPASPAPEPLPTAPVAAPQSSLEQSLAQFNAHQRELLRVHEQYLNHQADYFKVFSQLTQQQQALLASQKLSPEATASLTNSMLQFHNHQAETLRVHEQYLRGQSDHLQALMALIREQYAALSAGLPSISPPVVPVLDAPPIAVAAPAAPAPVAATAVQPVVSAQTPNRPPLEALAKALLGIVSEKTGYPAEMLELEMDIEADLGIDSIKRVEILGAMRERFPDLPQLKAEELAELRTLQQIVAYMEAQTQGMPAAAPAQLAATADTGNNIHPESEPVSENVPPAPVDDGATSAFASPDALAKALLDIVSEKTGYPAEMLELEMDIEADLGIDSIKRVEILGAMRERFPDLPQLKAEELAELRTLQQIVAYMEAQTQGMPAAASAQLAATADTGNNIHPESEPVSENVPPAPVDDGATSAFASPDALAKALLDIVSEKTGYPAEMLELEMDIEADLGIDSIKRVEILGAMRERFPDLPQLKAEELAELRTLQQIVAYMNAQTAAGGTAAPTEQEGDDAPVPAAHGISRHIVRLRLLPPPDSLAVTPPAGHVALLTDDGSSLSASLAQALTARGWRVVLLAFPHSVLPAIPPLPAGIDRVTLTDMSESQLEQALASITRRFGAVGTFIHVNPAPHVFSQNGNLFVEQEKAILKHVFMIAKHLKVALNEAARVGRSAFLTVTRLDGALGTSRGARFGAVSSGLFGLTKTLNLEWEAVFCRAIDLLPGLPADQAVQHIIAELHDPNQMLVEVAYGAEGRVTLVAEEANLSGTV